MALLTRTLFVVSCLLGVTYGSVSNAQLSEFITAIWNSDVNAATDVTVSVQGHTSSGSTLDLATHSLFSYVDEQSYFSLPTYAALIDLLDNYDYMVGSSEQRTSHESAEERAFLDALSKTDVMQQTLTFLHQHGYVGSTWSEFESELRQIWLDFYPRHGSRYDSSGFEHVFVGEVDDTEVVGFHNWIQFYLQEKRGNLDYAGYVFRKAPNVLGTHFTWMGKTKNLGSFIYGTSPEFEIALYTVCYYTRKNQSCNISINGHSIQVKAYDITHGSGHHLGVMRLKHNETLCRPQQKYI